MSKTATPEPTFDRAGYPTEETLDRIAGWPIEGGEDIAAALDFVAAAWDRTHGTAKHELTDAERTVMSPAGLWDEHRVLRLVTGGWSGNEDLVAALRRNWKVWHATWRFSTAGGLHVFTYPRVRP